ncbi:hypothetical protein E4T39_02057 [Aureobasidium subglaciale]|nr:hypothetical protein E4T39_02057 [Aureobasidium subglaciale]
MYMSQIPQLCPFIHETSEEWFNTAGEGLGKVSLVTPPGFGAPLDADLPLKKDVDVLVASYLDQFEHLHRVVHVPTFRRQYINFWLPGKPRSPAFIALILSMMAISACACPEGATYHNLSARWIANCDEWLKQQQSTKYHKLVQYQVGCLNYLAKRINLVRKKSFWMNTGSMVQRATMDGLNTETTSTLTENVFMLEMKRRIWHTIRELDLQNSFDFGLPSMLHSLHDDVAAPANLDDEDFDESRTDGFSSSPATRYTRTSYQSVSARSWALRLEISRRLSHPVQLEPLTYDEVLRYTHDLTQAISDIPVWNVSTKGNLPIVANAILQCQLKECVLAIHRPSVKTGDAKFWLSENIYHHMSRDILLLNLQIADKGLHSMTRIREDVLLASLSLTRTIMLQEPSSQGIIMSCSESIIGLMERCHPITRDKCLRSSNVEPWCYITICACLSLLEIRLGKCDYAAAKYSCAPKFLAVFNKNTSIDFQSLPTPREAPLLTLQDSLPRAIQVSLSFSLQTSFGSILTNCAWTLQESPDPLTHSGDNASAPNWLDTDIFDFDIASFDYVMDLEGMYNA